MRSLALYYDHTREWWGQAIWFYNHLTNSTVPQDLFEKAETHYRDIPAANTRAAEAILAYWYENHRMAELVLPEK